MAKDKVVSLFSGLGGIDFGLKAAGYQTVYASDIDSDCCDTLATNGDWYVECADVREVTAKQICRVTDTDVGEVGLLVGGPPCQPFSKSGFGSGPLPKRMRDRRADTIHEYFRLVRELRPKAFLMENVPQLIPDGNSGVERMLLKMTAEINLVYRTKYKLNFVRVNCADYGVPQIRQRIFIIASREGFEFRMPAPLYSGSPSRRLGTRRYRSAWDATHNIRIAKCELQTLYPRGRWTELLNQIPPGENYLWHTHRGGGRPVFKWRSRFWHFLLKLHPELPSWTIPANPGGYTGPLHWENRRLAVSELMALQTLPAALDIQGSNTSVRRQIGNAVPSAMAEFLGVQIREQFFSRRTNKKLQLQLRPAIRRPPRVCV